MTIFDELREDHDIQRRLMAELLETTGDSPERRELWDRLHTELEAHAIAEERHFYVPLIESDLTQEKARHSIHEHEVLDDLAEDLDGYDMAASQWLITARELCHKLEHHLEEEERSVFQLAGKVLSDDEKESLAKDYRSEMAERR